MQISKNVLRLTTAAITCALFIVAACNKGKNSDSNNPGEDTNYAVDHTTLEKVFDDAESIADEAASVATGGHLTSYRVTGTSSSPCATITNNAADSVITVFFGNSTDGCVCLDGNTRKGSIIINYTGNYNDSNSVHTITFDNYYVNDNFIGGTKTVTNRGHNSLGQPYYTVTVADGKIIYSSTNTTRAGEVVTWNTTPQPRIRTWIKGYDTPTDWSDDVYQITGNCTITRNNNDVIQADIVDTAALTLSRGCKYIEAGKINYILPSAGIRVLNYGQYSAALACDAYAILTINGTDYSILLNP